MLAQPEFRKSERFLQKSIIKLENDFTLFPHYAVSQHLSAAGIRFKSITLDSGSTWFY